MDLGIGTEAFAVDSHCGAARSGTRDSADVIDGGRASQIVRVGVGKRGALSILATQSWGSGRAEAHVRAPPATLLAITAPPLRVELPRRLRQPGDVHQVRLGDGHRPVAERILREQPQVAQVPHKRAGRRGAERHASVVGAAQRKAPAARADLDSVDVQVHVLLLYVIAPGHMRPLCITQRCLGICRDARVVFR